MYDKSERGTRFFECLSQDMSTSIRILEEENKWYTLKIKKKEKDPPIIHWVLSSVRSGVKVKNMETDCNMNLENESIVNNEEQLSLQETMMDVIDVVDVDDETEFDGWLQRVCKEEKESNTDRDVEEQGVFV